MGYAPDRALLLNKGFRDRVGAALGALVVPEHAWWATDFHLNWIAGALSVLRDGDAAIGGDVGHENLHFPDSRRRLVERNQEDADLVIAFEDTIILVEVKAFGYFTTKQISSKASRWRLLKAQAEASGTEVKLHFLLMSRTEPKKLEAGPGDLMPCRKAWPHAKLNIDETSSKLMVSLGTPKPNTAANDDAVWPILHLPPGADPDEPHDSDKPA